MARSDPKPFLWEELKHAQSSASNPSQPPQSPEPAGESRTAAFINRELSWLSFAARVLSLISDADVPLLERVKFAGIVGMLHDEFCMKRMSGLKRQLPSGTRKLALDGLSAAEEFAACRQELLRQSRMLSRALAELLGLLEQHGVRLLSYDRLHESQRDALRNYFRRSVAPILTPLAVDAEHPFPFISNLDLNLAVLIPNRNGEERFVRIEVPDNRPRWVPLPDGHGFVPLEQVIAANLDLTFPETPPSATHLLRVIRAAEADPARVNESLDELTFKGPGSLVQLVSSELKARRFAGVVCLQVDASMPPRLLRWLAARLDLTPRDIYSMKHLLAVRDLIDLELPVRDDLRYPRHIPATHPRLLALDRRPTEIFHEISRGDILLHHPYHSFDTSVLRFLEAGALDPAVLAIKITIYRTGVDSPIVRALAEAARRGKQVAVLVEITARFDEAPNIAWGEYLEREGAHVAYGVERLKTHVKLALIVREELGQLRRYAHVGTGNYHVNTARIYEDIGLLTCDPQVCEDVAVVFDSLTGATPHTTFHCMLVAPQFMRGRFVEMIRREAEHATQGLPSGIYAKMNQLQDPEVIRELYAASRAGVPITLNVRGLCSLRPGMPGLSENIRVRSLAGRFLEHSRLYRFTNGGRPEYFIGSADWMRRNLDSRVETVVPLRDLEVQRQIDRIIEVYEQDNCTVWDGQPDGRYARRQIAAGKERRSAQEIFCERARESAGDTTIASEPSGRMP